MKHFIVKHRYKRWEIVKIIKRHLYLKKPMQKLLDYLYKEHEEDIEKARFEMATKGSWSHPKQTDDTKT